MQIIQLQHPYDDNHTDTKQGYDMNAIIEESGA